jgi:Tir chaperone protein (CesT) family
MDMLEQAHALMRSVGMRLGVELEPDADGACGLRIDDKLAVTLRYEPTPPAMLAYSPVGILPEVAVEPVLRDLLEANHVWEGARGATWSLAAGEVVLSRLWPLRDLEAEVLVAELAVFVAVALARQQRLQSAQGTALEGTPAASNPFMAAQLWSTARWAR